MQCEPADRPGRGGLRPPLRLAPFRDSSDDAGSGHRRPAPGESEPRGPARSDDRSPARWLLTIRYAPRPASTHQENPCESDHCRPVLSPYPTPADAVGARPGPAHCAVGRPGCRPARRPSLLPICGALLVGCDRTTTAKSEAVVRPGGTPLSTPGARGQGPELPPCWGRTEDPSATPMGPCRANRRVVTDSVQCSGTRRRCLCNTSDYGP